MTSIISRLKSTKRWKMGLLLLALSLFCFGLSLFRIYISGTRSFFFLNWNLFLAAIPWFASTYLFLKPKSKWKTGFILLLWILFFPNAPYILTDLFHLRFFHSAPIWFDLVLVLSFAWTGLIFGFLSLNDLYKIGSNWIKSPWLRISTIFLLFLSSYGIYIGRYLRWNSWDIFTKPILLFQEILAPILEPFNHPRAWGMTILLGILLNIMFWTLHQWKGQKEVI